MFRVVTHQPLIEDVLGSAAEAIGADLPGYRGHVYRTYNFACALGGAPADAGDLAVSAAFHDLGIWTDRTFDYLEPSARRARNYVARSHPELDAAAIERIVLWHHRLRSCQAEAGVRGEAFRRADWLDLGLGLVRFRLPRSFVREVREAFPNAGFHGCLLREAARWAFRHPSRPLPMLSW
jgi:hypothetical protein